MRRMAKGAFMMKMISMCTIELFEKHPKCILTQRQKACIRLTSSRFHLELLNRTIPIKHLHQESN